MQQLASLSNRYLVNYALVACDQLLHLHPSNNKTLINANKSY